MHPYIHTAIKAIRRAEEILSQAMRHPQKMRAVAQHREDTPPALQPQLEAEMAMFDILHTAYPDHNILSPYIGQDQPCNEEQITWHLNGLEGMHHYLRHIPLFTIEIAGEKQGKIVYAVLFLPATNDLFYAVRGSGVCLNDHRLKITQLQTEPTHRIIAVDHPREVQQHLPLFFDKAHKHFPMIRSLGNSAISLAYLAAGKIDGFYDIPFSLNHCRAGYLIAKEAGALVLDGKGDALTPTSQDIVAASPKNFRLLLDTLNACQ